MVLRIYFMLYLVGVLGTPTQLNNNFDGRIVGGDDIPIEKVPYQISLQVNGAHDCGGSIIAPNYVVTAAHCLNGLAEDSVSVRAGTSIRESGGQVVNVKKIHAHPNYDTLDYDIAVLELSSQLILGEAVATIDLPSANQSWPPGTEVLVSGWGLLDERDTTLPVNLQGVTVEIIDQESCNEAYYGAITERMLCAGVDGGGKDACSSDSGGPLEIDGVLAGVVSFGTGCAQARFPGVYANVAALRDFVEEVTGL